MRAMQYSEYGPAEVMKLVEIDPPQAESGQIQLRVEAVGVNPADVKWRRGMFSGVMPLSLPHVGGYDVAGTVTAVGAGVGDLKPGDRIVGRTDNVRQGAYAEVAVIDAIHAARLPDGLGFDEAVAFATPGLTGLQLVDDFVRPGKGETVLVTGATGGVGRYVVRAALDLGARVVAAVRSDYLEEARGLGVDAVVSLDNDDLEHCQYDHVADTVGGRVLDKAAKYFRPGGKLFTIGDETAMGGPLHDPSLERESARKGAQFAYLRSDRDGLTRLAALALSGEAAIPVAKIMPLDQAVEAHQLMEKGGVKGKIVLNP